MQEPMCAGGQVTKGYKLILSLVLSGGWDWVRTDSGLNKEAGGMLKAYRWHAECPQNWYLKRARIGSPDLLRVRYQVHQQSGQKSRCLHSTTAEITQHLVVQRQSQEEDADSRNTRACGPEVPMRIFLGRWAQGQPRESKPPANTARHAGWQEGDRPYAGERRARSPLTRDGAAGTEPEKLNMGQGRKQGEIEIGWSWDDPITA